MNDEVTVISVRPAATDAEVAAISTAVKVLWPEPHARRHSDIDHKWRFSRRHWSTKSAEHLGTVVINPISRH